MWVDRVRFVGMTPFLLSRFFRGKGLGKNEQGMTEHIKVKKNEDGMSDEAKNAGIKEMFM